MSMAWITVSSNFNHW